MRRKRGKPVDGWPGIRKEHALGRVYTVHPNNTECYHLRLSFARSKTFLLNLLLAKVRSNHEIGLAVVSSGFAATLLEGDKTEDYAFKHPFDLIQTETPKQNNMAEISGQICVRTIKKQVVIAVHGHLRVVISTLTSYGGGMGREQLPSPSRFADARPRAVWSSPLALKATFNVYEDGLIINEWWHAQWSTQPLPPDRLAKSCSRESEGRYIKKSADLKFSIENLLFISVSPGGGPEASRPECRRHSSTASLINLIRRRIGPISPRRSIKLSLICTVSNGGGGSSKYHAWSRRGGGGGGGSMLHHHFLRANEHASDQIVRWLPSPIDTRNPRGATSALTASWLEIGYLMEGEQGDGRGIKPPERLLTRQKPNSGILSVLLRRRRAGAGARDCSPALAK
ncbi:hypothetical protein EVAR_49435_1 [Eumeta japonica]|uniref:ATP-dependent DNA helicase n=1 Tax=Eumeta variegata TaxID=151549 RepID=A0A4C1YTZ5_EUMVA|nr:hypothetical protein EVAR_49435_1 [Eumeta japonica]